MFREFLSDAMPFLAALLVMGIIFGFCVSALVWVQQMTSPPKKPLTATMICVNVAGAQLNRNSR